MGNNAPLDLSHLATRCAPDPDAVTMMTAAHAADFVPYDDRLVAIADRPIDMLRGLWLPDKRNTGFEWTVYGVVVAVGPGARLADGTRQPLDVRLGDRIVWRYRPSREEQTITQMFGERAILLREREVEGTVDDGFELSVVRDGDAWTVGIVLDDGANMVWHAASAATLADIPAARLEALAKARQTAVQTTVDVLSAIRGDES